MSDEFLTPSQVAEMLKVTESAVTKWRYRRVGPPFIRTGNTVRYRRDSFEAWLSEHTFETSSTTGA